MKIFIFIDKIRTNMDRNLALEFVRVTEAAAIAASEYVGKGDKIGADKAATEAMRQRFNSVDIKGRVVIGEGERDKAPMLYIGEEVGSGNGPEIDIAVDPIEGTNSVAFGFPNSIAVFAAGPKGSLLSAPDTYMNKIAVGPHIGNAVHLDNSIEENLQAVSRKLNKKIEDVTVIVLDRPRHKDLIDEIRRVGARVILIPDGDVAGAIAPSLPDSGIDILLGTGAAPEGVIAATAIKCLGGFMQGRLSPINEEDKKRVIEKGNDPDKLLELDDMARGDQLQFAATGIIDGPILKGVSYTNHGVKTHSIVMRTKTKTIRFLETTHHLHI